MAVSVVVRFRTVASTNVQCNHVLIYINIVATLLPCLVFILVVRRIDKLILHDTYLMPGGVNYLDGCLSHT